MSYNQDYDLINIRNKKKQIDYLDLIDKLSVSGGKMIDIGCGTCRKIIDFSGRFDSIYGVDFNPLMITKAKENLRKHRKKNINILEANNNYLPFKSGSFDFLSAMLTSFSPMEIHRVLKSRGEFLIEILGANDKRNFKEKFGIDEFGWRGILLEENSIEKEKSLISVFSSLFSNISVEHYKWTTSLNIAGVTKLLELTPTIRNFDTSKDDETLKKIAKNSADAHGKIHFEEHRMIITGIKE